MATGIAPDRSDVTRERLTLLATEDNSTREWLNSVGRDHRKLINKILNLYKRLAYHEDMIPNLHQLLNSPPASKDRVFFMWEFISETLVNSIMF